MMHLELKAFTNIVSGYPVAIMHNCKYLELKMRYLHNFCFCTPIFDLREHKYDIKITLTCIFLTKMRFLLIFG